MDFAKLAPLVTNVSGAVVLLAVFVALLRGDLRLPREVTNVEQRLAKEESKTERLESLVDALRGDLRAQNDNHEKTLDIVKDYLPHPRNRRRDDSST